jgi:hypothetical protein
MNHWIYPHGNNKFILYETCTALKGKKEDKEDAQQHIPWYVEV